MEIHIRLIQHPRNTEPFHEIISVLISSEILPDEGFTTANVIKAFNDIGKRPPTKATLSVLLSIREENPIWWPGFRCIRGVWYRRNSKKFLIAKLTQKINALILPNTKWTKFTLLVGHDDRYGGGKKIISVEI